MFHLLAEIDGVIELKTELTCSELDDIYQEKNCGQPVQVERQQVVLVEGCRKYLSAELMYLVQMWKSIHANPRSGKINYHH